MFQKPIPPTTSDERTTLEGAVLHHLDAVGALLSYDPSQLEPRLQGAVMNDAGTIEMVLETLDPQMQEPIELSEEQIDDLFAFLDALTSPSLVHLEETIPPFVPSGLPVDELGP